MANSERGGFVVVGPEREGVCPRCVKQAISHGGAERARCNHRLGNQAVDRRKNLRLVKPVARRNRQRSVEGEIPNKNSQPAKHDALCFGEQTIAPVERCLEGPLSGWRGAWSCP